MDYALGEVGLLPKVFWRMTWPEYERACHGYRTRQSRAWERTRELLRQTANLHRPKGTPVIRPEQVLRLPTDNSRAGRAAPKENLRDFHDRMRREILAKQARENGNSG